MSVKKCVWLAVAAVSLGSVLELMAYDPITPPEWATESGAVRLLYLFPDANPSLTPDESSTIFDAATASVTLGAFSAGWRDYENPLHNHGLDPDNGAWDLGEGPTGSLSFSIPMGALAGSSGFESYNVKILVSAVCFQAFVQLPSLQVAEYTLSNATTNDAVLVQQPPGSWRSRSWTVEIEGVQEDELAINIVAQSSGSLIDSVEIYLLAVPVMQPATVRGTPYAWFDRFGISLKESDTWDDADYYDSDGDGMLNWEEYVAGTDPTDAESLLKITWQHSVVGEEPELKWIGGTSGLMTPYVIEWTPTLRQPDWQPIGESPRVEGTNSWQGDAVLELPAGFYRVIAPR